MIRQGSLGVYVLSQTLQAQAGSKQRCSESCMSACEYDRRADGAACYTACGCGQVFQTSEDQHVGAVGGGALAVQRAGVLPTAVQRILRGAPRGPYGYDYASLAWDDRGWAAQYAPSANLDSLLASSKVNADMEAYVRRVWAGEVGDNERVPGRPTVIGVDQMMYNRYFDFDTRTMMPAYASLRGAGPSLPLPVDTAPPEVTPGDTPYRLLQRGRVAFAPAYEPRRS